MSAAVHWAPWAGITAVGLRELARALREHPAPARPPTRAPGHGRKEPEQ